MMSSVCDLELCMPVFMLTGGMDLGLSDAVLALSFSTDDHSFLSDGCKTHISIPSHKQLQV